MKKPSIKITLVDRMGARGCHRGHRVGDTFDFDTRRGEICPMAMLVMFPFIDILRYGGALPGPSVSEDRIRVCCPDADVINIFEIEKTE